MRVLVTGGAGFIGSHLVDALRGRGDDVTILDDLSKGSHQNLKAAGFYRFHRADVRNPDAAFAAAQPELVFHLAAQADVRVSLERPAFDADVNIYGTVRVLEAARRYGAPVVLASSGGAIYGECPTRAAEGRTPAPLCPYGASKLCAETYLQTWNRLYGTRHTALRLGNVYGPRQDPAGEAGVVAIFAGAIRAGEPRTIYGDGGQARDFIYVDDVVRAFIGAAGRPGVFNIGTGVATSVSEIHSALCRIAGVRESVGLKPARPGELYRSALDPVLAVLELGWFSTTPLEVGLAATWAAL